MEGIYIENNFDLIDQAITDLEKERMDFEVGELAEEAAQFAEKEGKTKLALKYMKSASQACLKFNHLGDDQK